MFTMQEVSLSDFQAANTCAFLLTPNGRSRMHQSLMPSKECDGTSCIKLGKVITKKQNFYLNSV